MKTLTTILFLALATLTFAQREPATNPNDSPASTMVERDGVTGLDTFVSGGKLIVTVTYTVVTAGDYTPFGGVVSTGGETFAATSEGPLTVGLEVTTPTTAGRLRKPTYHEFYDANPVRAPPDTSFDASNTIWVDAGFTETEDGTQGAPFNTITEGFAASSAGFIIRVAPGTYAESLTVPHDLFIDAIGAVGVTAIDISSGRIMGRLYKWEFHANGAIIHPDLNDVDNADCISFAVAVGLTQSAERYSVGSYGGADYDFGSGGMNLSVANGNLIDLYGIGVRKPFFFNDAGSVLITLNASNNLKNLKLASGAFDFTAVIFNGAFNFTGEISDIESIQRIHLSNTASNAFNGTLNNVSAAEILVSGTLAQNNGSLIAINLIEGTGRSIELGNFGGDLELISGALKVVGVITSSASIDYTRAKSLDMDVATASDMNGIIHAGTTESLFATGGLDTISGKMNGLYMTNLTVGAFINDYVSSLFELSNFEIGYFSDIAAFDEHTLLDGSNFRNGKTTLSAVPSQATGEGRAATAENKALWQNVIIERNPDDFSQMTKFPVSTGATLVNCEFRNFVSGSSDPLDSAICGRDLIRHYANGDATVLFWDFANQRLDWDLDTGVVPQTTDGTAHVPFSSGVTFDATIYISPTSTGDADGDLTLIEGLLVEFELVDLGGGVWHLRTTAADAATINTALGSPTADITADSIGGRIGMAATITLNNVILNGASAGQEITIITTVAGGAPTHQVLTDGTTITWDQSLGTIATLTLTDAVGTRTLNITNDVIGFSSLSIIQDATDGLELIATWDSEIKWTTGQTPTLSEGLSEEDNIVLVRFPNHFIAYNGYDFQ